MEKLYFFKRFLFLLSLLTGLQFNAFSATYYSKNSGGNWTDPNSWSTTGYGQPTNSGTYPKTTDLANIGDGYTIIVNASFSVGQINIGQGSTGVLEFSDAGNYSLTVINYLTINSGAKCWYNGSSSRTHTLNIGTNLSNAGALDLYSDADDVVNLVFNRSANSVITGNGTFDLNTVTINKSTSTTYYADVQSSNFETAIRDLVISYGTYNHNNSGSYSVNAAAVAGFTVLPDAIVKVSQGTLHLSPSQDITTLQGTIVITAGTLRVGSSAGNGGLHYDKSGSFIPKIDIQGGSAEVYGGLSFKSGNASDPLNFNMSGGTLLLNSGSSGTADSPFKINDVTGSVFLITDGSVILSKANSTGFSVSDFDICGSNGMTTIGGGTIQFGDNSTPANTKFNFTPYSNITFPNIKITGLSTDAISLVPSANSAADIKMISLYIDQNKTFDVRAVSGSTGDSRVIAFKGNMDGINSLYCDGDFISRTGNVLLQGGEGQQVAGNSAITLYDLTLDNYSGAVLAQTLSVKNSLTLTDGVLYTSAGMPLKMLSGSSCDAGSSGSFIDGPFVQQVASASPQLLNFPVGKNGVYRPVVLNVLHANTSAVEYEAELLNSSPRALNYVLPDGVDRISDMRYFQVSRSGASNLISSAITLNYDADDWVADYSNLKVMRDNGSAGWIDAGGTATGNSSGAITSASFNTVSTLFTLGNVNGGNNPLPVELISFNASKEKTNVLLKWSTASEKNSDFMEVQKSSDGINFEKTGSVKAAGNSSKTNNYSFTDSKQSPAAVYYRLKLVDIDGVYEFSKVVQVKKQSQTAVSVFPNPARANELKLNIDANDDQLYSLQLIDLNGNVMLSKNNIKTGNGSGENLFNQTLPGNYLVRIQSAEGEIWQQSVVLVED